MVRVAVNIVTYNSAETISICLEHLLAQTGDFEVCVIDNASADATVSLVGQSPVRLIEAGKNLGYAAGHNLGIRETQSVFVLTLNPDVRLQPGFIQQMTDFMDTHPEVGSASGLLLRVEGMNDEPHSIDSTGLFMRPNRRQGLRGDGQPVDQLDQPEKIFGPDGAAAFYRRSMLEDIAFEGEIFDEDFFMHKEDVDVCWRARLRGWDAAYVPQAVAHHVRTFRPGQRQRVGDDLRFYGVRNRYLLMMKNEVPSLFWRHFLQIAWYDLLVLGYILLREPRSLRAYRSAWQLRGRMLQKRRQIQSRRSIDLAQLRADFSGQ